MGQLSQRAQASPLGSGPLIFIILFLEYCYVSYSSYVLVGGGGGTQHQEKIILEELILSKAIV